MVAIWQVQQAKWAEWADHEIRYCFLITHEYDYDYDPRTGRYVTTVTPQTEPWYGPKEATEDEVRLARKGQPWRVLDDDGAVMARGRMWTSDAPEDWTSSDACFAPLDDFGAGMYGCTTLQYFDKTERKWKTL